MAGVLVLSFQGRLRCEMCMTTNDQRCNESLRLIYTEPSMMRNFPHRGLSCTE